MRHVLSLLMLLALLALLPATALPQPGRSEQEAARAEALRRNRELLKKWRKDADHYARLERDLAAFWALPEQRRAQLRLLDRQLHQLNPATRQRLLGVMERYHAWVERLPEEKQQRIRKAAGWKERLSIVKDLRDQEWVARQPKVVRDSLAGLSGEKWSRRVAELRFEQRQRLKLVLTPFRPEQRRPVKLNDFPPEVRLFVRDSLRPLLTHEERRQLDQAEGKPWPTYARTLALLADRHPIPLPGPIGPVRLADLPEKFRERLHKHPAWLAALKRQEGRWPEFGVILTMPARKKKPQSHPRFLPMPSRLEDFSPALRNFVTTGPLGKTLASSEKEELKKAEGKWPDYPRTLLKLAKKHRLTLPGMTLPGPKELWDRVRSSK